jgi:hypothetical protein
MLRHTGSVFPSTPPSFGIPLKSILARNPRVLMAVGDVRGFLM